MLFYLGTYHGQLQLYFAHLEMTYFNRNDHTPTNIQIDIDIKIYRYICM